MTYISHVFENVLILLSIPRVNLSGRVITWQQSRHHRAGLESGGTGAAYQFKEVVEDIHQVRVHLLVVLTVFRQLQDGQHQAGPQLEVA